MADEPRCNTCGMSYSTPNRLRLAEAEIERLRTIVDNVVRNCRHVDDTEPRDEVGPLCGPTWAKVAHICGLGSTSAMELCHEFGVDPHYDCTKDESAERIDDLLASVREASEEL